MIPMRFYPSPGKSLIALRQPLFLEYLTEPFHIILLAGLIYGFGSFRAKVAFDLVRRRQNAYSILHCADEAKRRKLQKITLIECGVASGVGLKNMCHIAQKVTQVTGVEFELLGFDTGKGLPPPRDYRDHPELFQTGDFPMFDVDKLQQELPSNAKLVLGDLAETAPAFIGELREEAPVGYIVIDVDYYWSAVEALGLLIGKPETYLPCVLIYFDDVNHRFANDWCGELLAIREFNESHKLRKLEQDRALKYQRIFKESHWLEHMYKLHVLDHPERQPKASQRERYVL
jgi:hypothetical protein